ncbi:MAG TPA: hypothetical protein VLW45_05800 [Pelomicrobium sp.]|nr:hypothetical protein [Pelomicrobium sp.]
MSPLAGIALVLAILALLLVGLRAWQVRRQPHPELTRKALHLVMGVVTLSFPWLFHETWPVVVLGVLAAGGLIAVKRVDAMRDTVGDVVFAVARPSGGELYFPVAVVLLFWLSDGDPILYGIPILILTLADATAALIGVRYGFRRFATADGGAKSVEGSIAFFMVAFLAAHVPLLLFTEVGRAETLLIGLNLGFLTMLLEAVAWRGIDNLLLPLIAFFLLDAFIDASAAGLASSLAFIGGFALVVAVWRRFTTLDLTGLVAVVLVGYVFWALGGWRWLAFPLIAFLTYVVLWQRARRELEVYHNVLAIVATNAVGLLWLAAASYERGADLLYFNALAYAAQLAAIGHIQIHIDYPRHAPQRAPLAIGSLAWLVMFLPYVVMRQLALTEVVLTLAALPVVVATVYLFRGAWRTVRHRLESPERWWVQGAVGAVASLLGLIPFALVEALWPK